MKKIFYTDTSVYTSESALKKILREVFGIQNAVILRNENGKPYIENCPSFSITHTKDRLYIAFSENNVGLDTESLSRKIAFGSIIKKFSEAEREEIKTTEDFLIHWTIKESAIKFLGGTLAHDLKKLSYQNGRLTYENKAFPADIFLLKHEGNILAVCGNNFENTEFIRIE